MILMIEWLPWKTKQEDEMEASLSKLSNGAIVERFDELLADVIANLCDPNTDPKAARQIVIKATFKGNAERSLSSVSIDCHTKLASANKLQTSLHIGLDPRTGLIEAIEPKQQELFPTPEMPGNVSRIKPDQEEVAK